MGRCTEVFGAGLNIRIHLGTKSKHTAEILDLIPGVIEAIEVAEVFGHRPSHLIRFNVQVVPFDELLCILEVLCYGFLR